MNDMNGVKAGRGGAKDRSENKGNEGRGNNDAQRKEVDEQV